MLQLYALFLRVRANPERRLRHHLGVDPPLIFCVAPEADRTHLPHMGNGDPSCGSQPTLRLG